MKTKLVQVGNSKGIRIPKAVIQQVGLQGNVEMTVRGHELVLRPAKHPRAGWDEAMARAVKEHGNELSQEDKDWIAFPAPLDEEEPA
jgi:antitoxin MazE